MAAAPLAPERASLVGLAPGPAAEVTVWWAPEGPDDGRPRRAEVTAARPFAWLAPEAGESPRPGDEVLRGPGPLRWLRHYPDWTAARTALKAASAAGPAAPESQFLLQGRRRLYADLPFARLRRCQVDLETATGGGDHFSDPDAPDDRILAIGLQLGPAVTLLTLDSPDDAAERELLQRFNAWLAAHDPDTIEGHNVFRFDLHYLARRCRRLRVPCAWGRDGRPAAFRPSRLRLAERQVDFPRCDIPGRAVVDTWFLVQLADLSAREMASHGLKESARHFGISPADGGERTHLDPRAIEAAFHRDRPRFAAYLTDDLREVRGLADQLLPTYYEQARTFPLTLQEAILRGQTAKIDLVLLEDYYHGREALPVPGPVAPFEGGLTRSFRTGVHRSVVHVDVASLYPSLLLQLGRAPAGDSRGAFLPLVRDLRARRLEYKRRARTAPDPADRAEAAARQAAFKVLINSFYGYLGFEGARFGDGALAAEVTAQGRALLQRLIERAEALGAVPLEADTDGIYLASPRHATAPEALVAALSEGLPEGIELELGGVYDAMFCYKAKNYALRSGRDIILRGSAFRSRALEPFLRELTDHLVRWALGLEEEPPARRVDSVRAAIAARRLPVEELARSEVLAQSPEAYLRGVEAGGKPRRAAAEAALPADPRPRAGDRIAYFLAGRTPGMTADWQRAWPVSAWSPDDRPYDSAAYLERLEEWWERYAAAAGADPGAGAAGGQLGLALEP